MTSGLRDPDKPAGFVVEVDPETGVATRNDGTLLQPAEKNPWYLMMSIAGVPEGDEGPDELNELEELNRRYWNGWVCSRMSQAERTELAEHIGLSIDELAPLTPEEKAVVAARFQQFADPEDTKLAEVAAAFREIDGQDADGPEPWAGIDLSEIHFSQARIWSMWVFTGYATFASATFSEGVNFSSAYFSGTAWFHSATFAGIALFLSTTFDSESWFNSATFNQSAFFDNAVMKGDAHFISVNFKNEAMFYFTTFAGEANFTDANFFDDAVYLSASFTCNASFTYATFNSRVFFESATFARDAFFTVATFNSTVSFSSVTFIGAARFVSAVFATHPKFITTWFRTVADFSDASFGRSVTFREASFETEYPVLDGVAPPERMEVVAGDRTTEREVPDGPDKGEVLRVPSWPAIPDDPEKLKAAQKSAAALRHAMGRQGLPEEEHFFFRKEMGFEARIGGVWRRLPYVLFREVSFFGYSVERPAALLILTILVPWALVAWLCAAWPALAVPEAGPVTWGGELALSVANTFSFFGFQRLYFDVELLQARAWVFQVMGAAQTVLGFVFLFFLGLGLRTRFRMR
ncbi:hypothetical protein P1J78_00595 [Psychromarinibacter sp. C21-152]|uniref:Pentapeptide repeat-containing protein n=1 Tax=Psychromarinibacter sediminicola TaxID=3033385 RepID=A0AAE3NNI2_9RHOB|nr:hypothetical protein [Psychromarinibacter sediminicola]MDF0599216.1 hypothetical protein [Psychromarinibacter sediminicola]